MKISLPTITNGQDLTTLNTNFSKIASALNTQVLYRDNPVGEANMINQDVDFNGNRAYNLSDVLVNGVSVLGLSSAAATAVAQATTAANTATAASVTASNAATAAAASAAQAAGTVTNVLLKTNNLSDLSSPAAAKNNLGLVKADVGLSAVDNTSDANKPLSNAASTALSNKLDIATAASTYATIVNDNLKAPKASPTFTGNVVIPTGWSIAGYVDGSSRPAGQIGEVLTNSGTGTPMTTNVNATVVSLGLTAGEWEVEGTITFVPAAGTTITGILAGIGVAPTTLPANNSGGFNFLNANFNAGTQQVLSTPRYTIRIAAPATVYLIAQTGFGTSTMTTSGFMKARRVA